VTFGIQLAIVLFPLLSTLDSDGQGKIFTDCNLQCNCEKIFNTESDEFHKNKVRSKGSLVTIKERRAKSSVSDTPTLSHFATQIPYVFIKTH